MYVYVYICRDVWMDRWIDGEKEGEGKEGEGEREKKKEGGMLLL